MTNDGHAWCLTGGLGAYESLEKRSGRVSEGTVLLWSWKTCVEGSLGLMRGRAHPVAWTCREKGLGMMVQKLQCICALLASNCMLFVT